ncbi:flagellar hook protein FlgE [Motilibacter rhizosphaerae]|uniref:Flagellar hook protein FlgE n=1 Tax=Motilibacter rhizosphaerae TaxID=598652 RepID=A0A4Q7NW75_9ACTN|nr:flagellar hook protein FlgE [Motilibacter rhizosphaerae]RZS91424.1 flagellar hook protein FlgE [Motilibacter rhizosphaerae]
MLRSLFTGISGLKAHQTMLDVVGNNIANVNTAGYKSSSAVFEDTMSQMLRAAGAPQGTSGGTNPAQVGLGVRVAGISTNFSQGSTQSTGRSTDLSISGDGFFVTKQGGEDLYTRAGSFNFDANGNLVTNGGAFVQGWTADATGKVDPNGPVGNIAIPTGTLLAPSETLHTGFKGNLVAGAGATPVTARQTFYDPQGVAHDVVYTLTKATATSTPAAPAASTGNDGWNVAVTIDGNAVAGSNLSQQQLQFSNTTGQLASPAATGTPAKAAFTLTVPWGSGSATPPTNVVSIDVTNVREFGGDGTFEATQPDGSTSGTLSGFNINPDGTVIGVFSNGLKQPLAKIALANFNNPPGLEKVGSTAFRSTVNSGLPELGSAGAGGRGALQSNTLEMSNVDLATEFTGLIIAQRGFQANSKVITTSDDILQQLVNMKQ